MTGLGVFQGLNTVSQGFDPHTTPANRLASGPKCTSSLKYVSTTCMPKMGPFEWVEGREVKCFKDCFWVKERLTTVVGKQSGEEQSPSVEGP